MAVSLRERPIITEKDAERLVKRIQENNRNHQKLIERLDSKKYDAKGQTK